MKKFPFYLFLAVLVLSFLGLSNCSNRKKTGVLSSIVPLALLGTGKTGSPPINKTYPTEETIILNIGQQLTLSPSQHVEGSTYTISPQLPDGLSLDPNTGIISGAPTASFPSTVFTITQTKPDGTKTSWKVTIGVNGNGQNSAAESGTPSFNLPAGHYTEPKYISITTSLSGGTVRCTFDGTEPTSASDEFSEPLHIWSIAGRTIKCRTFKDGTPVGDTVTAVYSYPPLKTGQTTVYQDGDDASMNKGVERSYTDNGDGTVKDNATGLVWMKCISGTTGTDCSSGTETLYSFEDSKRFCEESNLAGKKWKLPSSIELTTLISYQVVIWDMANWDTTFFPNFTANGTGASVFGTSDTVTDNNGYTYWRAVLFGQATFRPWNLSDKAVRCVERNSNFIQKSLIDNGDGTIKDKATNLLWQKCAFGQSLDQYCTGQLQSVYWWDAIEYCKNLQLAGKQWRLPNINELLSLFDYRQNAPAVNSPFTDFGKEMNNGGTLLSNIWSSTTRPSASNGALPADFYQGGTGLAPWHGYAKDTGIYGVSAKCVSDP